MKETSPYSPELIRLLRTQLGLSDRAVMRPESTVKDSYPILFDLIIEDAAKTYIVELKRVVRLDSLSHLGFLKLLLKDSAVDASDITFVIAGKRITPEAMDAAEKTGIQFIKLPADLNLEEGQGKPGTIPVKLTSPKSWQVISHLLKMKEASIRQLSIASRVSYGWSYATAKALVSKGIASDAGGRLRIIDINKLINGIAWERPFERLFAQEIKIAANSAIELAREICLVCDEQQIACAFTSFTAGEIYTGYSARHDSVYLYLEKKNIPELAEMFDVPTQGDIAVRIYAPDRDVFMDRRAFSVEGLWLASPSTVLLDCAGQGYAGRDLTQKLVEIYGQL
ncbi:MAG: hypothetical protein PHS80_07665 [Methanothrix sp.]|nr:hypothetical protein [Methanothrix sp.]MDD4446287.1 hypothetical protein [Methanothrix sp.]